MNQQFLPPLTRGTHVFRGEFAQLRADTAAGEVRNLLSGVLIEVDSPDPWGEVRYRYPKGWSGVDIDSMMAMYDRKMGATPEPRPRIAAYLFSRLESEGGDMPFSLVFGKVDE